MPKTGSTSLHHFFLSHGLRSYHSPLWRSWQNENNIRKFDKYDCFSDGDNHNIEWLDQQFPNSKFIYTTRSLRSWLISRHMHRERRKHQWWYRSLIFFGIKGNKSIDNCDERVLAWIKYVRKWDLKVHDYFADKPEKFLKIDLSKEYSGISLGKKLEQFLTLPEKNFKFPHKNQTPQKFRVKAEDAVDAVLRQLA